MTKRPAPFRACDVVRAIRAYAKGAGVPADTVSVAIKDGEIVVSSPKNLSTDENALDQGLRELMGQKDDSKVLQSGVTN